MMATVSWLLQVANNTVITGEIWPSCTEGSLVGVDSQVSPIVSSNNTAALSKDAILCGMVCIHISACNKQ